MLNVLHETQRQGVCLLSSGRGAVANLNVTASDKGLRARLCVFCVSHCVAAVLQGVGLWGCEEAAVCLVQWAQVGFGCFGLV